MTYSEIKRAAREGRASVHLHGFCNLPDGGQEYSDNPAQIDGWAIYIRVETPDDPQQPFDLHELPDDPTMKAPKTRPAHLHCNCWAMLRHGTTIEWFPMPSAWGRALPGGRSLGLLKRNTGS